MLRLPDSDQERPPATYASLKNLDLFSNALVNVENIVVAPEPPQSLVQGTAPVSSLPQFPGQARLAAVLHSAQRPAAGVLGHGRPAALQHSPLPEPAGAAQPLPLYAPPLNPLQLIAAEAAGAALSGAHAAGADLPLRDLPAEGGRADQRRPRPTAR